MKFFVSRQQYWGIDPEDGTVVEVAVGGLDFANPDMRVVRFKSLGEGKEYNDPIEAAEAAIAICVRWRAEEPNAKVAYGSTGGNTLPFDAETEFEGIREWAKLLHEKLPKCAHCSDLLDLKHKFHHDLSDGEEFCSENCADINYENAISDMEPDE